MMRRLANSVAAAEAVNEILIHYYRFLYRVARRKSVDANKIDDVVSSVAQDLLERLPRFRYQPKKGRFRDYLAACVRYAFWKIDNEERRHPRSGMDPEVLEHWGEKHRPSDPVESTMRCEELMLAYHEAAQGMNEDHRRVVRAILVDGEPYAKVARESGYTVNNVQKVVSRARDRLRDVLRRFDQDSSDQSGPWGYPK